MIRFFRCLSLRILLSFGLAAHANSLVQFRTVLGDVEVELLDQEKPATVANFKRYVEAGLYHNSFFHRAVHNFVLQGGGFTVADPVTTSVAPIPAFPQVTNEFKVGPFRSNVAGTIAMAKTSDPNSATSQFFFNLVDNSRSLDSTNNAGGFTVFGVVKGDTNILGLLNSFRAVALRVTNVFTNANQVVVTNVTPTSATNIIVNAGGVFSELPLLGFKVNAAGNPHNDVMVYVDVTLLSVRVDHVANGGHEISWNSAPGGTNHVEFTTVFPPVWQSLTNLIHPTAGRSAVIDTTDDDDDRFYRVRVDY